MKIDEPVKTLGVDRVLVLGVAVAVVGIAQFAGLTTLAMKNYAGGSGLDRIVSVAVNHRPSISASYDWSRNFLSDLGRTKAWSGKDNRLGARYFNSSVICLGLALGVFFAISLRASENWDVIATIIALAGGLSSMGLVGIGLTPYDLYFADHMFALSLWILPLPVIAIAFAFQSFASGKWIGIVSGSVAGLAGVGLIVAILAYATAPSMQGHIVMQKVLVGMAMIWFSIVVGRISLASIIVITHPYRRNDRLAEEYLRKISKKHLRPPRSARKLGG